MPDANALRMILNRVDTSAVAIQNAAGAMMKFYDCSSIAVNEWRNSLQTCSNHQLLPLLYVANEVLQNSKRNRGNKFLEAMSPVLIQALRHICSRDQSLTEKVRRTAKIWGDRRVFSVRFVNEVLIELERYRNNATGRPTAPSLSSPQATFSPGPSPEPTKPEENDNSMEVAHDDDDEDIRNILEERESDNERHDDDDDDEDIFATDDNTQKLDIEINLGSALEEATGPSSSTAATVPGNASNSNKAKRRRSSMSAGSQASTGGPSTPRKRRVTVLSPSNLSELWTRMSELQKRFDGAQHTLARMEERLEKQRQSADVELSELVGDELQRAYQQNLADQKLMATERKNLHAIAQERRALELEAVRYLPWLEKALKQDEEDIVFCDLLEQKIVSFRPIHVAMREARDKRLEEERRKQQEKEELERQRREREEQEKFRRAALKKETEAKPGMVWNPTTREYQSLNTDESWRE